jgi:hypothetical protein
LLLVKFRPVEARRHENFWCHRAAAAQERAAGVEGKELTVGAFAPFLESAGGRPAGDVITTP